MTDDLIAFLRERYADEEQTAKDAQPGPWMAGGAEAHLSDKVVYGQSAWPGRLTQVCNVEYAGQNGLPNAEHIAYWDPARVLAEVEAKRLRLDEIIRELADDDTDETAQWRLKVEALPYAAHPAFRPEWSIP